MKIWKQFGILVITAVVFVLTACDNVNNDPPLSDCSIKFKNNTIGTQMQMSIFDLVATSGSVKSSSLGTQYIVSNGAVVTFRIIRQLSGTENISHSNYVVKVEGTSTILTGTDTSFEYHNPVQNTDSTYNAVAYTITVTEDITITIDG
jgi:hypothetical protein